MEINFSFKTNCSVPYINGAIFLLGDTRIFVDRDITEYTYNDGVMEMTFVRPYIHSIDDVFVDDICEKEPYINEGFFDQTPDFLGLEVEDDAPEGYVIENLLLL